MKRAVKVLSVLYLALLPVSAAAASPSPSPAPTLSPALDRVLLAPPAGYAPIATTGVSNGHFTAHDWGQTYGAKSAEAERLLGQYGFVDGYNMTWAAQTTRHVLNEFVLAFRGGKGASQWLAYDKAASTSQPIYQHPDSISGIPQYFGEHESQSSVYGQAFLDGFVFAKGNDVIGVAFVSLNDDNLTLAGAQAKNQFASAPASTIPPALWPEGSNPEPSASASPAPSSGGAGKLLPYALIIGAAAVAIGLGASLLLMRARKAQMSGAAAPVAQAAASPGTVVAPVTLPQQMSADGNFWYDGERWVAVTQEAPPFAQRSPDGAFWWDGYSWRPVPLAQAPASGR
ncbi:MAG TPA: hypothetical protein VEU76_03500 [Candidatus Udaeobacter sp.]|nr:hypothetical protein [Candidatus Udaeobacter sp.]